MYNIPHNDPNNLRLHLNEGTYYEEIESDELIYYNSDSNLLNKTYTMIAEYCDVDKDNIFVNYGSSECLRLIFHCIGYGKKNITSIVLEPTYEYTLKLMAMFDINITSTTINDLSEKITQTKQNGATIVYLDMPNNPYGYIFEPEQVNSLLENNKDVLFIIDEAYIEFSDIVSSVKLIDQYKNLIIVRTFSKGFRMAGYRAGYIVSDKQNIQNIRNFSNPLSLNRHICIKICNVLGDIAVYNKYFNVIKTNRKIFSQACKCVRGIKNIYSGHGNFILLEFEHTDVTGLQKYLERYNILVRKKSDNFIRISISDIKTMEYIYYHLSKYQKSALSRQLQPQIQHYGILLAAGKSSRFRTDMGTKISKVITSFNNQPLIVHKIHDMLRYMEKIIVVLGYDSENIKKIITNNLKKEYLDNIIFIINDKYDKYENWYSVLLGLEIVPDNYNVIINESDAIFNKNLLEYLVSMDDKNIMVCKYNQNIVDCEMKVRYACDKIISMSKKLHDNIYGDYIGLCKIHMRSIPSILDKLRINESGYYEANLIEAANFQIMDIFSHNFINMNDKSRYQKALIDFDEIINFTYRDHFIGVIKAIKIQRWFRNISSRI